MIEETTVDGILDIIRREDESFDPCNKVPTEFTPDSNATPSKQFDYEEYVMDFFRESGILDPNEMFYIFVSSTLGTCMRNQIIPRKASHIRSSVPTR